MICRLILFAGVAAWFAISDAAAQSLSVAAADAGCIVPDGLGGVHAGLPHTADAVRLGHPLTVVALGSSSTAGAGASRPDLAYPAQLEKALRQAWPGLVVTVHNAGVGGETTDQMSARIERDVLVHRPDLVIWQMGSNGLTEDAEVAAHRDILRRGIASLKAAGTDVVLMDPQYAPRLLAKPHYREVIDGIAAVAAETGVGLFQRFALMQFWVTGGHHVMDELVVLDQLHMSDLSYTCVARALSDGVVAAALPSPPGGALAARK